MKVAAFRLHLRDRRADRARVRWLGEVVVCAVVAFVLFIAIAA